jgi:hypothetical protein
MSCSYQIDEIRFLLEKDLTWAYVHISSVSEDCPEFILGWHGRAWLSHVSIDTITEQILACFGEGVALNWTRATPPERFPGKPIAGNPPEPSSEPLEAHKWL